MDAASDLLELAKEKFGELTEAEEKLFRATANGEIADYSDNDEKKNDPAKADDWDPKKRVLKAERIARLCTDKRASQFVTHRGIRIKGARVDEEFDLEAAKVPFPLFFKQCKFAAGINFKRAQIGALYMPGTHTGSVSADGLKVDGPVFLSDGFRANGEVRLLDAVIGGNLQCDNGQFINKGGKALTADRLKAEGSVFLSDGFRAEGEVRLLGAALGQDLSCIKGQFINEGGIALHADGLKANGYVFLRTDFKAEGEVRFLNATVGSNFECENSQFINKRGKALTADGLKVNEGVYLRNAFLAEGEVRLLGAVIGGNLDCGNGQFINRDAKALSADNLKVEGSVFLRDGFRAEGEVRLLGARISGNLVCSKGQFTNNSGTALFADGLKVGGHVILRDGFKAQGTVIFTGATIHKHFCFADVDSPEDMTVNLGSAKIGTLLDDRESWPGPGRLLLHGLEYAEISHQSPTDSKMRIEWLRRQERFWPQPYEQLAEVLRKSGDGAGARDVLIAKNKDKAARTKLTWSQWFWYRLFGRLIGYGHKPWRAIPLALVLILLGSYAFKMGYSCGLMTPPTDSAYSKDSIGIQDRGDVSQRISEVYPVFNSLVYSIDVFVPVVDLHQAKYWLPNANRGDELRQIGSQALCTGGLLVFWLWLETAFGWVLTTLFLVGLTGLVRT